MFGFAQMASAEVEHRGPESRTQAGTELEPRAFAQLQPVIQTFNQTSSVSVQLVLPTSPGREDRHPESQTQAGSESLPPAFAQHVLQHAACSTVTCEQHIQQVVGTQVTHPWWLLPPQTHLYETISA